MLTVREAELSDAPGLARVRVRSWQAGYRGLFPDELLDSLDLDQQTETFARRLGSDAPRTDTDWVCEQSGEIVGWLSWGPTRDNDDSATVAELWALYVHPAFWGVGAGRRLMGELIEHLEALGIYRELSVWVLDTNLRARGFYQHMGCQPDGHTKLFELPDGSEVTEVRYRRTLD